MTASDELPGDVPELVAMLTAAAHRISTAVRLHWRTVDGECAECRGIRRWPCPTYRILAGQ